VAYISFQPSDYFNTKIWTGNGSTNALTSVGFQPDWVWIKQRGGTTDHHFYDAVRGVTKALASNNTDGETTKSTGLTAFGSDGFTLGADGGVNGSSNTYVGWSWKANGQGSANTDGSINTTYTSANTTAGISIIQYTGNSTSGATIAHGLGAVPKVFMCKKYNSSGDSWRMYTEMTGNGSQLALDQTSAADSGNSAMWNSTSPTSTLITLGNHTGVNGNTDTFICYAFAEKKGFSKFGKYKGNGSADGTFVYTGFKPSLIIYKNYELTQSWNMNDTKRLGYNPNNAFLFPNLTQAESDITRIDIVSNGFKFRTTDDGQNGSGYDFIFMAFAEEPLVSSNGVPATAR
jgi:hypothetical protein|tara:strand:- start:36 stop:1073 length:1038 start_codon:yes stop_codon:yes gene_type:complete